MSRGNSRTAKSLRRLAKEGMRGMSRAELERRADDGERCEGCGGTRADGRQHARAGLEARWTCIADLSAAGTERG